MPKPTITTYARNSAGLLTLGLFTLGSFPAAGQAFPGTLHWAAHLISYAVIAVAFGLGFPQWNALVIWALLASMGTLHEVTEIITNTHPFEGMDAMTNGIGTAQSA